MSSDALLLAAAIVEGGCEPTMDELTCVATDGTTASTGAVAAAAAS